MNINPEFAEQYAVIRRHLGGKLTASSATAANTQRSPGMLSLPEIDQIDTEMVQVLQQLLQRYIMLLESSEHGGWSLEEEKTVRAVCAVLSRRVT